ELAIVLDALLRGFAGFGESFVLDESGDFSHRSRSVGVGSDLRFLLRALARRMQLAQRAPVLVREDLDEALARRLPVAEDLARPIAAGVLEVVLDQALEDDLVAFTVVPGGRIGLDELLGRREHRLQRDGRHVAVGSQTALRIPDVGDAARHARGEVAPGRAEHYHGAARHVLAAMVARALDDGGGARVAHAEALAGHAGEVGLALD